MLLLKNFFHHAADGTLHERVNKKSHPGTLGPTDPHYIITPNHPRCISIQNLNTIPTRDH